MFHAPLGNLRGHFQDYGLTLIYAWLTLIQVQECVHSSAVEQSPFKGKVLSSNLSGRIKAPQLACWGFFIQEKANVDFPPYRGCFSQVVLVSYT